MPNAVILIVEKKQTESPTFAPDLQKKGFEVYVATNGNEALARLDEIAPDLVVVNAASLRSSGKRICQSFKRQDAHLPIILILKPDHAYVDKNTAEAILHLPFTIQKLYNRIKSLLPSDAQNLIHAGPIRLDREHGRIRCLGKSTRLTPRLVALLTKLIQHRGEVIEREVLFKEVWNTDYTGDTRTLDVHISWLRRAIEIDPAHPKFLKTVRGIGYRLDV
ncbi:MAG: response regulator transcription factor [Candidatus Villigracilaceae bacterium]